MTTAELVNLIVRKFGGSRVVFKRIDDNALVAFRLGDREYIAIYSFIQGRVIVQNCEHGSALYATIDNYSRWVEGVLNGMVRNEAGELVTNGK